jgi:hypothetical protein
MVFKVHLRILGRVGYFFVKFPEVTTTSLHTFSIQALSSFETFVVPFIAEGIN